MKITIINKKKEEWRYSRVELDDFVRQLGDGTYRQQDFADFTKEVCFAAEWMKMNGELKPRAINPLVLLTLDNLRDIYTTEAYKQQASQLPYTLLCFQGHDGHSVHIVCPYSEAGEVAAVNAFRKLHYIYSSQLQTPLSDGSEPLKATCKACYDQQPYYNPSALPITVSAEPEDSLAFRSLQEEISDFNNPEELPGVSIHISRMRRFHDCLDQAIITCRRELGDDDGSSEQEELFQNAVLEQLADGCRQSGLPEPYAARLATFIPLLGGLPNKDVIQSVFRTAYLRETLTTIPLKYVRPSALLAYKTEAYMKQHYTLRLNVMTGTPEYRMNAVGYGFHPLDKAARNTMAINALKAGVESWDKDLNRYIESDLIPRYYPMEDYLRHLPRWNGKKDYVGELARRVKTDNLHWENDFHTWMLSMVAQWLGKNRQHGNAIVPLLIGPQGIGKTVFCRRLLPEYLQTYFNDRISMKSDNDIFIAMSGYALINIDEFDAMKKSQQPLLKYLISKTDVKFRPPYGKVMEERQRFASFIATTNERHPLTDTTGSRRFVCVWADDIDNTGIIPYSQVYAQLVEELRQQRRYWFDDKENERIMRQNMPFLQVKSIEEMIACIYLPPEETPQGSKAILVGDIVKRLASEFSTFSIGKNTHRELGRKLTGMGFKPKARSKGTAYVMKEIDV